MVVMTGRRGRNRRLEFIEVLATAFRIGAPGKIFLEFIAYLAGRRGRMVGLEFKP
jgi:hypothetical protein